jgi:hypothetical protein
MQKGLVPEEVQMPPDQIVSIAGFAVACVANRT